MEPRSEVEEAAPDPEWSFGELVRADLAATLDEGVHRPGTAKYRLRVLAKVVMGPNVRVVLWHRVAHELAKRPRWRWLAFYLRTHGIKISGAEIHPDASIGPGLYVVHAIGVGVGRYAVIGRSCRLHLGSVIAPVALHNDPTTDLVTRVGDEVSIGTNAVVLAGLSVGDGAVIGANAVVMRDVEPYSIVSSSPGRVVGQRKDHLPKPG
jgi:serine O-acetyltransferase